MAAECRIGSGGLDQIGQNRSGRHRYQLIRITEQDQRCVVGQRVETGAHQRQIHHRGLVDDHDLMRQALIAIETETVELRLEAEQSMQGLGAFRNG